MTQPQTGSSPTSPSSSTPRVRKNIDSLTQDELNAYINAVTALVNSTEQYYNYIYFEQLHDRTNVGPCEHNRETFLPWHRMALWLYEDGLRRIDPNVTIPYWDFTQLPSGDRYPTAFEDTSSILYNYTPPAGGGVSAGDYRNVGAICKPGIDPSTCLDLPWPYDRVLNTVLNISQWSTTTGSPNFGGGTNGYGECDPIPPGQNPPPTGPGKLEFGPHNDTHSNYVAGYLSDTNTAGMDPLFWSFHTFIDLLWDQWQQQGNTVDTCLTCGLCWNEPNPAYQPFTMGDVIDVGGPR
ncbi:MAG TPA: tyrosinase family protein, partial [Chloroflexia bacterium]